MQPPADLTIIAIGGHSLLDPSAPPTVDNQFAVTAATMVPIADLIERGEHLILTHGNGPQVGFMQLRSELARSEIHEVPLDSLVADSQGSLGYMIQRALREELLRRGMDVEVVTVVTEVEVDVDDQAFDEPTKPIGLFYSKEDAAKLKAERGWDMIDDAGRGYRQVVPSPTPIRIVQLDTIRRLSESGAIVVCCGGGGIPVTRNADGHIQGHAAVVDKDRASALLAVQLRAKRFVITTGVDYVYRSFQTDNPIPQPQLTVADVRALNRDGEFPAGSMRPKMESAIYYLRRCPAEFIVCSPYNLVQAMDGKSGTHIVLGDQQDRAPEPS